ncbi:MAG: hypothetical protein KC457_11520 [Myxococcales bacterium]|nr:hypothetical protein [Myxococcales bacterium]
MRNKILFLIGSLLLIPVGCASEEDLADPLYADSTDTGGDDGDSSDPYASEPDPGATTEQAVNSPDSQQSTAIPRPVWNSLALWPRADAGVNVNQYGVYRWDDQSPASNNATQSSSTALPKIVYQVLNTYPVLRFDGNDFFVLNSALKLSQHTIFVVVKSSKPDNGFHMILGAGGNTANTQFRFEDSSSVLFAGLGNGMPIFTSPTGNNKIYHTMSVTYNGSAWKVRRDGVLKSTNNFQVQGTWDLRDIGAWFGQYHLVGDLAEIIVYNRALTTSELNSVQDYLDDKYGFCTPNTCGISDCGYVSNGCGGTIYCGACTPPPSCGNGICETKETLICPQDCGLASY